MNSFTKVISVLGLTVDSQGENGWLYAVLKLGGYDYEGSDVHTNVAREVVRRLTVANVGAHTLARITAMLNELDMKIERGATV